MHNPLDQFQIRTICEFDIGTLHIKFTNSALAFIIVLMMMTIVPILGMIGCRRRGLIIKKTMADRNVPCSEPYACAMKSLPNRIGVITEMAYSMVTGMVKSAAGSGAERYVPFVFAMYFFIMFCNLLGLVPGVFTVTSQIAITFVMAIFVVTAITIIGFIKHGFGYLRLFLPEGIPWIMAPLVAVIELFAYLARPISLSLRLAINMTAGHIMLKVIAGLGIMAGIMLGILPLLLLVAITGFEVFVAVLQAYIFSILSCVYLSDALHLH